MAASGLSSVTKSDTLSTIKARSTTATGAFRIGGRTRTAQFERRTASLVGQYDAYVPAQLGADSSQHHVGALTLGENIGDPEDRA